jgi:putative oxidoreductase
MVLKLLKTDNDLSIFIIRITLGIIIFAHGAQKLLGIWGGHGSEWTVEAWSQWWSIPPFLTYSVIFVESFGALLLIFGVLTRIWALLIGLIMLVAIWLVHLKWGFYMNWYMEPQTGEGFEYHILIMAIITVLLIKGGGKWSLDLAIFKKQLINNKQ